MVGRKEEPEFSRLRSLGVSWKWAEESGYHLAPPVWMEEAGGVTWEA